MARRNAKPKDNRTIEQKSAQRAVERMQKPQASGRLATTPQVSKLDHLSGRKAGPRPAGRIQNLPIIDEVATHIKAGWPDIEVARFIHQEGHLEHVSEDNLRREVRRYRTRVLKPFEVAEEHLSAGAMEAVRQVTRGIDELRTIEEEINTQRALAHRVVAAIGAMCGEMEGRAARAGQETKPPEEGKTEAPKREPIKVPPKFKEAEGLSDSDVRAYLMGSGFAFKQLEKHWDTMGKNLLRSAQIKSLLGIVEMSNPMVREEIQREGDEETLVAYTRRRFAGRADAMAVLQNPESRNKITTLFQRAILDGNLHRDLRLDLDGPDTIEAEAEPLDPPEAPSEAPKEPDPAPKVS